jgi:Protein of unknown function (DUF2846)
MEERMRGDSIARCWLRRAAGCAVVLVLAGCAGAPAVPTVASPRAAGSARIWFYRDYEPSVSLNFANVALNGVSAGSVHPDGSALYRDVSPGHYRITVESEGADVNQAGDVDLSPGQEAFVKIQASDTWESGSDTDVYKRDTFYVRLMPPQVARIELGTRPLSGG